MKPSSLWREFRDFAIKGNAIELAIGLVLGQAFTKIVNSLVTDIILPPIGWLVGNVDFSDLYILLKAGASAPPYASLQAAKEAGAITLNIGLLLNSIINFVIIAWALFWVVRGIGRLRAPKPVPAPAPTTKECPYCFSSIPIKATRCPYCTSHLEVPDAAAQ